VSCSAERMRVGIFALFLILDFFHLNMMPVLNFSFMAFIYVQVMVYFINWFSYSKLSILSRVHHAWSWCIFLPMYCWILFASTFFRILHQYLLGILVLICPLVVVSVLYGFISKQHCFQSKWIRNHSLIFNIWEEFAKNWC
jgi:Mn2+/Fe2+ NRAMP family transporter